MQLTIIGTDPLFGRGNSRRAGRASGVCTSPLPPTERRSTLSGQHKEEQAMGDEKNRAAVERMRELLSGGDMSALARGMDEYASEDLVEEWPQSGERIRGRANVKKLTEGYGEATGKSPKMTFKRLIGGGDVYVVEGTI